MPSTSHRVSTFTESVIRSMTRLANQHGAINLSQGFPDFDPPEILKQAAERTGRAGPHQYAVTWGAPGFRAALARKQSHFTGLAVDPDENLVVTCGSTEAMMAAMMTACNPGDRVVIFSPSTKTTWPTPSCQEPSPSTCRCGPLPSHSIRTSCGEPLRRNPRR